MLTNKQRPERQKKTDNTADRQTGETDKELEPKTETWGRAVALGC